MPRWPKVLISCDSLVRWHENATLPRPVSTLKWFCIALVNSQMDKCNTQLQNNNCTSQVKSSLFTENLWSRGINIWPILTALPTCCRASLNDTVIPTKILFDRCKSLTSTNINIGTNYNITTDNMYGHSPMEKRKYCSRVN